LDSLQKVNDCLAASFDVTLTELYPGYF